MNEEQLEAELKAIFSLDLEGGDFIKLWTQYVHLLDDVIDEPSNSERTLKAFSFAQLVYSCPFYIKYKTSLYIVSVLVDNSYADSVVWEKSNEEWKRAHADLLRHAAYDIFFAAVFIIAEVNNNNGRETLRKISLGFREKTHKAHLNDIIKWSKDIKAV